MLRATGSTGNLKGAESFDFLIVRIVETANLCWATLSVISRGVLSTTGGAGTKACEDEGDAGGAVAGLFVRTRRENERQCNVTLARLLRGARRGIWKELCLHVPRLYLRRKTCALAWPAGAVRRHRHSRRTRARSSRRQSSTSRSESKRACQRRPSNGHFH